MPWRDAPHGGLTSGEPWIEASAAHREIDVAAALGDPDAVFAHYRSLIAPRRTHPIVVAGEYLPFAEEHPRVLAYARGLDGRRLSVIANFWGDPVRFEVPEGLAVEGGA